MILGLPLVVFLGIVILIVGAITSDTISNNKIIGAYSNKFKTIKHPDNTSIIKSFKYVKSPPGNGTDCFYFVGELRQTSSLESEIKEFYSKTKYHSELSIEFADSDQFSEIVPYGFNNLSQFNIKDVLDEKQKIYIIYWLIPEYLLPDNQKMFDLRCT